MCRCVLRAAIVVLMLAAAASAYAQTVDEIVARNVEAKGGAAKWQSVNSVKMTGRISMGGKELPLTVYAKRPNLNRQEITLQANQTMVQAFDGSSAWGTNPMTGTPQELPNAISQLMKNSADFEGALMNYKDKGHTAELVGRETLDGTEVYHLKLTMKSGHVQHHYLDAKTGVELKTATDVDLGTGQKQTIETQMSNFQQVEGVMIPHTMKQAVNGKPLVEMTIDKVEFNAAMDDAMFRMPGK